MRFTLSRLIYASSLRFLCNNYISNVCCLNHTVNLLKQSSRFYYKTKNIFQLNMRNKFVYPYSLLNENNQVFPDHSKTVFVHTEDTNLKISFFYKVGDNVRTFTLLRKQNDLLGSSIERLKINIQKILSRRTKEDSELEIKLFKNEIEVRMDSKNDDAWIEGAVLKINDILYTVSRNCPQIIDIRMPRVAMAGFPIVPRVSTSNCNVADCQFLWFRLIESREKKDMSLEELGNVIYYDKMFLYALSESLHYSPCLDDIDHTLVLVTIPKRQSTLGPVFYCKTLNDVLTGPANLPYEIRHCYTSKNDDLNKLRVVSYNILADIYSDSAYARDVLFNHCAPQYLDMDYRRLLILKELEGYNFDVACLQEVDEKEFQNSLKPFFEDKNNICLFSAKEHSSEGLATLFNSDKLDLVDSHRTIVGQLIDPQYKLETEEDVKTKVDDEDKKNTKEPHEKCQHFILDNLESDDAKNCLEKFDEVRHIIKMNSELFEKICKLKTTLQVSFVKFKDLDNTYLLVMNTHLYFAPNANHIRMLQGYICVKYMEFIRDYYIAKLFDTYKYAPKIYLIFCGDMNSSPEHGLHELMTKGFVPSTHDDWTKNDLSVPLKAIDLHGEFLFSSSYNVNEIAYTNFVPNFNSILDYIYYEKDNLECETCVPFPPHEDVIRTGGLPSEKFPSDHLALIANLKRK